MKHLRVVWLMVLLLCCIYGVLGQSQSINYYGGFESNLPSFWNIGNQPSGYNTDMGDGSIPVIGT